MSDQSARERLVETFLDLVRIDSPSRREAACAAYCARELEALGARVTFDDTASSTGSDTGNLIAELPGTVPGTLVLSAHMDCVEPCTGVEPVVADGVIVSAGETVLGADDKAGLAVAIETARRLLEGGGDRPTLRFLFTVQEEVGLLGAKSLRAEDVHGDLCLVLDADGTPGGIVIGAPTHYTFTAEFIGKAAHAGVAPEKGISAVRLASDAISRLPIGRVDERSTANVGTVHGGTATNVIAARVSLTGECRSLDPDRVEELRAEMDAAMRAAAADGGGEVVLEWSLEYGGFALSEDDPNVLLLKTACADAGLEARCFTTGGGSDANVLAAQGMPTVALACGMSGVHSTNEEIRLEDLESLAELCVATARRMAR